MTGIHREYQQLVVMDRNISSMLEKMVAMQGGISQRLKWAAGANPQVSEVLKTVESSLEHKTSVYQVRCFSLKGFRYEGPQMYFKNVAIICSPEV